MWVGVGHMGGEKVETACEDDPENVSGKGE